MKSVKTVYELFDTGAKVKNFTRSFDLFANIMFNYRSTIENWKSEDEKNKYIENVIFFYKHHIILDKYNEDFIL